AGRRPWGLVTTAHNHQCLSPNMCSCTVRDMPLLAWVATQDIQVPDCLEQCGRRDARCPLPHVDGDDPARCPEGLPLGAPWCMRGCPPTTSEATSTAGLRRLVEWATSRRRSAHEVVTEVGTMVNRKRRRFTGYSRIRRPRP